MRSMPLFSIIGSNSPDYGRELYVVFRRRFSAAWRR